MTTATSLIFIAVGAILAFAVSYQVAGISIQTVGAILIVVGSIGLALALATIGGYAPWGARRVTTTVEAPESVVPPTNAAPPTV